MSPNGYRIFPRFSWRLRRLFTIRVVAMFVICCLLVEIGRRYLPSVNKHRYSYLDGNVNKRKESSNHINDVKDEKKINFDQQVNGNAHENVGNVWPQSQNMAMPVPVEHVPYVPEKSREMKGDQRVKPLDIKFDKHNSPMGKVKKKKEKPFYTNRIIHFDLKGAAPKVWYLKEVMRLIKANGATGILLEWEDTFPFTGILEENRSTDAYTMDEVDEILSTANKLGLTVIPLVQTFGHLEWLLKLEKFRRYRENDHFPQVICMADENGVELVKEAIRQVMSAHLPYGIQFFHIGADEAFEYGVCTKDREWMSRNPGKFREGLAASHLSRIANFVKSLSSDEISILAWYDMIKQFDVATVRENNLDNLLEVVVWDYSETLQQQNEYTWTALARSFPIVWGSSSYKGANQASSQMLDLRHYVQNTKEWSRHRQTFGPQFRTFRGLILTGWQRYDHFAVLCEIMPVGLPSAIVNLLIATAGEHINEQQISYKATKALNCPEHVHIDNPATFSRCKYPGWQVFAAIHSFLGGRAKAVEEALDANEIKGWLNRFNIQHNCTQLWYLRGIEDSLLAQYAMVLQEEQFIRDAMKSIFRSNTIDEWLYEYLDPIVERLSNLLLHIRRLRQHKVFPTRNFPIRRAPRIEL